MRFGAVIPQLYPLCSTRGDIGWLQGPRNVVEARDPCSVWSMAGVLLTAFEVASREERRDATWGPLRWRHGGIVASVGCVRCGIDARDETDAGVMDLGFGS